ncbi:MAG: hypothetical protein OQJ98_00275 [Candidatus Pacebacteria bacterium]|nr:hypothetical protein [Candidatus Paceibacterota bacterium]
MKQYLTHPIQMLILSAAGALFSGYLSAVKLFTKTCAFGETCPYFLGYPACWYGFALFVTLFVVTLLGLTGVISMYRMSILHVVVAGIGVVFSGSFAIPEIVGLFTDPTFYTLGLSTCIYGSLFFILCFVIALRRLTR